jgi:hypothetical protein
MFKLSEKTSYTWPVKYRLPDGGKYDNVEFVAEFKRLSQSRLEELAGQARDGKIKDEAFVEEILLGWSGIKTAAGEEFEYSAGNRDLLLDTFPGLRYAVVTAFQESIQGSVRKN